MSRRSPFSHFPTDESAFWFSFIFDLWRSHLQGKDPTGNWKMCGGKAVKRVYEKNVKGYVYAISGGPGHKMQLPKDERRGRECTHNTFFFFFFSDSRPRPKPNLVFLLCF